MNLKKIIIPDIYLEPGVTFESFYDYKIHTDIQDRLNSVYVDDGLMLDKYKNYQLIITTSPTKKDFSEIEKKIMSPIYITDSYIICQPHITKQKDYKAIEFFVYVSYDTIMKSEDPYLAYVAYLKDALTNVFSELEYSVNNISKVVDIL